MFHDVYLGTRADLTEANRVAQRSVTTMYYHVPGLTPGATYYWRVDEIEADGTTVHAGNVWTFTAQALTAYLPSPADGAVDAAPTPMLTWQPGQAATKHHVYFSDTLDTVQQRAAGADKGEVADATFAPGALAGATMYFWAVDELVVSGGTKAGPVWSFSTYLSVDDFEATDDEAAGYRRGSRQTAAPPRLRQAFAEQTSSIAACSRCLWTTTTSSRPSTARPSGSSRPPGTGRLVRSARWSSSSEANRVTVRLRCMSS
jgi:hypothetical protein